MFRLGLPMSGMAVAVVDGMEAMAAQVDMVVAVVVLLGTQQREQVEQVGPAS